MCGFFSDGWAMAWLADDAHTPRIKARSNAMRFMVRSPDKAIDLNPSFSRECCCYAICVTCARRFADLLTFLANLHCAPKKQLRTEELALVAVAEFARIPMQRPMPNRNSCEFRYQPTAVRFPGELFSLLSHRIVSNQHSSKFPNGTDKAPRSGNILLESLPCPLMRNVFRRC